MDLFLYGQGETPNLIIGKYDQRELPSSIAPLFAQSGIQESLDNIRVNKYELWFTNTISFLPYSGPPAFVINAAGNTQIAGNLLVDKNLTINGTATFQNQVTINSGLLVTDTIDARRDVQVRGDLYVNGRIISPFLDEILARVEAALAGEAVVPPPPPTPDAATPPSPPEQPPAQEPPAPVDNFQFVYENREDQILDRGPVVRMSYNGTIVDAQNLFNVGGGGRSGNYRRDQGRLGAPIRFTSTEITSFLVRRGREQFIENRRSQNSTGGNTTITLTFPTPVSIFSVTVENATYEGNEVIAYNANNEIIGRQSIPFSGDPQVDIPPTRATLTGAISRIELVPPQGELVDGVFVGNADYVTYNQPFWEI